MPDSHPDSRPDSRLATLAEGVAAEGPWIVVDKPSGWHSVEGRSDGPTVEAALRTLVPACASLPEAGLVHRLDLGTSGCLLAATTEEGWSRWRARWSRDDDRRIVKTYLAEVELPERAGGLPAEGVFRLHFGSRYRRSAKVTVSERGGPAEVGECRWRTRQGDDGCGASSRARNSSEASRRAILEVELIGPGRRHQIRAGFASLGAPLVGDELYGASAAPRLRLHAWRLAFDGVLVESPAPGW